VAVVGACLAAVAGIDSGSGVVLRQAAGYDRCVYNVNTV
jgi:hypothetical protein